MLLNVLVNIEIASFIYLYFSRSAMQYNLKLIILLINAKLSFLKQIKNVSTSWIQERDEGEVGVKIPQ